MPMQSLLKQAIPHAFRLALIIAQRLLRLGPFRRRQGYRLLWRPKMRFPLIRADFWITAKQRTHMVELLQDDPDFLATKDFGEVLAYLADQGYHSARLISPTHSYDIEFRPSTNTSEPNKGT